jgi:NADH-quinone oxidoreductase subunit M
MIFGAAYLLWMFQRIAFTDVSEFFVSMRDHISDIRPIEVLTLAPLGALVVMFGLFPGLVLDIVQPSVTAVLDDASKGAAAQVPPIVPLAVAAIIVAIVVGRILAVINNAPDRPALVASRSGR